MTIGFTGFLWLFFALATAMGGIVALMVLWIARLIKRGKPLVITLPGVPGAEAEVRYRKLPDSQFSVKFGDEGKTWVVDGRAAYPAKGIASSIAIVTDFGANLIAPSKDHVTKDIQEGRYESVPKTKTELVNGVAKVTEMLSVWAARFRVWDPLLMWRSNRENDMEDLYSAQGDKDPWQVRLFPMMLIGLLAVVGILGFVIWKVMPILSTAAHGTGR